MITKIGLNMVRFSQQTQKLQLVMWSQWKNLALSTLGLWLTCPAPLAQPAKITFIWQSHNLKEPLETIKLHGYIKTQILICQSCQGPSFNPFKWYMYYFLSLSLLIQIYLYAFTSWVCAYSHTLPKHLFLQDINIFGLEKKFEVNLALFWIMAHISTSKLTIFQILVWKLPDYLGHCLLQKWKCNKEQKNL